MRHGFIGATQKPSDNFLGGRAYHCHTPNGRTGSLKCEENAHCLFFSDIQVVAHHKFVPQGQTANQHYYLMSFCRKMCGKIDLGSGIEGICFSTVITHLLTPLCLCINIWQKKVCHSISSLLTTSLASCDFFLFPKLMIALKGRRFNVTMIQAKLWEAPA
jgi:hypothetical protein